MNRLENIRNGFLNRGNDNMIEVAERLNAIEPTAGLQTFHNADFLPVLAIIGVIMLGAILVSNGLMTYFAYKKSKNRLF